MFFRWVLLLILGRLPRELVHPFIHNVSVVRLHVLPFNVVDLLLLFVQQFPDLHILYGLVCRALVTVGAPLGHPLCDPALGVVAVSINCGLLYAVLVQFQAGVVNCRQLHLVVGAMSTASPYLALAVVPLDDGTPSSFAWIAEATAVCVHFD